MKQDTIKPNVFAGRVVRKVIALRRKAHFDQLNFTILVY